MQKYSALLVLGMGVLGPMRAANSERCGELHYTHLAGGGFLAYRCSDESCWLRKPAVCDAPREAAGRALRFFARSDSSLNLSSSDDDSPLNEGMVPSDKKGENP